MRWSPYELTVPPLSGLPPLPVSYTHLDAAEATVDGAKAAGESGAEAAEELEPLGEGLGYAFAAVAFAQANAAFSQGAGAGGEGNGGGGGSGDSAASYGCLLYTSRCV